MADDIFEDLMREVHQRVESMPENSYTTKLIRGGVQKMGSKILEESLETILAAQAADEDRSALIYEACDLIYHLWVLLGSQGITVDELRTELTRRRGVSGLDEKKNRKQGNSH